MLRSRTLRLAFVTLTVAVALASVALPASAANIILVNADPPGAGLNDPTPVAPVGGNPGTTLGQQRINVYLLAADIWGQTLDSNSPVFVGASFAALSCTPTSGTLGSAGTTFIFRNFPGAPLADTWYHSALADAIAGADLNPGFIDVNSRFNSRIGTDPGCLTGRNWYYGFDHQTGGDFDFLNVVAHEIGHGLGFSNFVNESTGALQSGFTDVFADLTYDVTTGKTWTVMTQAERAASAVNDRNVVWIGAESTAQAANLLDPRPSVVVLNPSALAGSVEVQTASFGPAIDGGGGTTGKVVVADDGTGVASDGCEPLVGNVGANNANGKIVLVDRGTCAFVLKVANAQAAGAKGVIVANNVPVGLPGMGGSDPSITIPSVGVTQGFGDALRAAAAGNTVVKLVLDGNELAGAVDGFVRIFAPNPVQGGSSGSHWDVTATPNLLMEPFINSDLRAVDTLDLSPALMQDIGWVLLP
ncbi:MAG TPA: PA domain-containing protein [Thermoanaerobaculia bacterium]|nr:PA domain-containing protein [Thermoanaerobaculia bacterium]